MLNNPDNAEHVRKCTLCLNCETCIEGYSRWIANYWAGVFIQTVS